MREPFWWEPGWDAPDEPGKPAPPGELSFEQECSLITPEAILALQADFLCDPCGIPLVDPGKRPPNEDGASHVEMVVHAATRVRRLLVACHGEQWRRQETSPCYAAIRKTPLPQIAKLALALMRGRGMPLSEAVAAAVTHIEAEDYVRLNMALGGSYEGSIEKFRLSRQAHKDHLEQVARMPKWNWQRDEHGKLLPVELEAGLKALFPLPGYKGQRERSERLKRFSSFLMSVVREEYPKVVAAEEERKRLRWDEERQRVPREKRSKPLSEQEKWGLVSKEEKGQITVEAGSRLREMKRDGIPPHLFRAAILWVDEWHKESVSATCSEASRARWSARTK